MIFTLSFYIFSLLLSYTDCSKFKIPNITLSTLFLFLITFGFLEDKLNYISFIISLVILIFFVIILLIMPKQILGGGDIKYIMVVAIYLEPLLFPLFLILTGLCQALLLIFIQKYKRRKVAPMAPAIFMAVCLTEIFYKIGIYQI